ncbi:MAG: hypothetical protein AB7F38_02095 [Piscinibacter sp.]
MPRDRPPDAVVSQLQRRGTGPCELPREQIAECIPGELEINPRRQCARRDVEVPWNQNLEGVKARVDQEVEDRQLRQPRLLRLHGRDPIAMRERKQVEHAAQLGHGLGFRRSVTQFDSSWRVRVQDEP